MNVNQQIESALSDMIENIWPNHCPDSNPPDEYLVYNSEYEAPGVYADDQDQDWIYYMQIHLYTRRNYIEKRKKIRQALRKAGFLVTEINSDYEKDSGYNHLTFSCCIEE